VSAFTTVSGVSSEPEKVVAQDVMRNIDLTRQAEHLPSDVDMSEFQQMSEVSSEAGSSDAHRIIDQAVQSLHNMQQADQQPHASRATTATFSHISNVSTEQEGSIAQGLVVQAINAHQERLFDAGMSTVSVVSKVSTEHEGSAAQALMHEAASFQAPMPASPLEGSAVPSSARTAATLSTVEASSAAEGSLAHQMLDRLIEDQATLNSKEDLLELYFLIPYHTIDHDMFKTKLWEGLKYLGARPSTLAKVRCTLREGSTIAELRGPPPAIAELKALRLPGLIIMGFSAKLTPAELKAAEKDQSQQTAEEQETLFDAANSLSADVSKDLICQISGHPDEMMSIHSHGVSMSIAPGSAAALNADSSVHAKVGQTAERAHNIRSGPPSGVPPTASAVAISELAPSIQ